MIGLIALFTLSPNSVSESAITNERGQTLRFSDWSPGKIIEVPSQEGKKAFLLRTCDVSIITRRQPADFSVSVTPPRSVQIALLTAPETGHYWIGRRFPAYVFFDDSLIGVEFRGKLSINRGFKAIEEGSDGSAELEKRLREFVFDPFLSDTGQRISLERIFGYEALIGKDTAMVPSGEIVGIEISDRSMTVSMTSTFGTKLELTVNSHLVPVAARANGKPVMLLLDGVTPIGLPHSPQTKVQISSPSGNVEAWKIGFRVPSASSIDLERMAECIVIDRTGHIWFGPRYCKLFLWEEQVIGFKVKGTLMSVYVSRNTISTTGDTASAFRTALTRFAQSFASGDFAPTVNIEAKDVFGKLFAGSREVEILNVRESNGLIELTLKADNRLRDRFKMFLNQKLEVVSEQ